MVLCSGLEDQMLARVVAEERPDLEEMKNTLIISNATMRNELKALEDTILEKLSTSENPVDDIELITALEASKAKSTEIKVRVSLFFVLRRSNERIFRRKCKPPNKRNVISMLLVPNTFQSL